MKSPLLWNAIFFLALLGAAWLINKVASFPAKMPKVMCNVFVGLVFILWLLGLFGLGK